MSVCVMPNNGLKQRCRDLKGEGNEANLAEVQIISAFDNGINRRDQ